MATKTKDELLADLKILGQQKNEMGLALETFLTDMLDSVETILGVQVLRQTKFKALVPNTATKISFVKKTGTDLEEFTKIGYADEKESYIEIWQKGNEFIICSDSTIRADNCKDLFSYRRSLQELNFVNFDTTYSEDMSNMFLQCSNITSLNLVTFDTSKVKTMNNMFGSCINLENIDFSSFNTANVENMDSMFYATAFKNLDFFTLDTTNVKSMNSIFSFSNIESANINFKGGNLTSCKYMFEQCPNLKNVQFNWEVNTTKLTDIQSMFRQCTILESVDFGNMDTSKVTTFYNCFQKCSKLSSITPFSTASATNMSTMFAECYSFTELDLSFMDTSNVTTFNGFIQKGYGANLMQLTTLNLSSFNTSKATNFGSMFFGCTNLTTIYANDFTHGSGNVNSSNMFADCTSLVGGNGTTYSSSHKDFTYARVDTAETPGYFTAPAA